MKIKFLYHNELTYLYKIHTFVSCVNEKNILDQNRYQLLLLQDPCSGIGCFPTHNMYTRFLVILIIKDIFFSSLMLFELNDLIPKLPLIYTLFICPSSVAIKIEFSL